MNFEFSDESMMLRDEARRFLAEACPSAVVRGVLEGREPLADGLWREMAAMGWLGAAIPEIHGGAGMGHEALCVLSEELGRACAPVPFASSIGLAAEAVMIVASEDQKAEWLPGLADGSRMGTLALYEGPGQPSRDLQTAAAPDGRINGVKWPVLDGVTSTFALVAARDDQGLGLYHVDLDQAGVERRSLQTVDPSRGQATLGLTEAVGERLGSPGDHWPLIERVLERSAILTAFEQVGGAEACLYMARDYAMDRIAFGRPLASFQAIKHKLADVYVELEIARANAYFGAWALSEDAPDLPRAAAAARVSAIEAFRLAAKENIQTHGGSGFTWEFDCHLYYRRAKLLALTHGGAPYWMDRLVAALSPVAPGEVGHGL